MKREKIQYPRCKIQCPRCHKMVATKHWAPGYPGLWKHTGQDKKECPVGYVRPSKVYEGKWVES